MAEFGCPSGATRRLGEGPWVGRAETGSPAPDSARARIARSPGWKPKRTDRSPGGQGVNQEPTTSHARRAWHTEHRLNRNVGSPSRTRTCDKAINSRLLYQLSYRGSPSDLSTHQSGAAKSRLDHLDETSSRTTTWFHRTKTSNNALKQSLRPERIWLPEQDSNLRQSD